MYVFSSPNVTVSIDVSVIGRRTKVFTNRGVNCVAPRTATINYVLNAIDDFSDDLPSGEGQSIKNYQLKNKFYQAWKNFQINLKQKLLLPIFNHIQTPMEKSKN